MTSGASGYSAAGLEAQRAAILAEAERRGWSTVGGGVRYRLAELRAAEHE
jgi:hypothetical protein